MEQQHGTQSPHVTVDVRRPETSPYAVPTGRAILAGWRWDDPTPPHPRRGVAPATSEEQKADQAHQRALAAEAHQRAVNTGIAITALAAPALVGPLSAWKTCIDTRRRAANLEMPVTMKEGRALARGNLIVAAVLWFLLPVAANAILIRLPDWEAIWTALRTTDLAAIATLATDGALPLAAGPIAGILGVILSAIRTHSAGRALGSRARLRNELSASLDAALELPAGTAHANFGWEKRDGADAAIDMSRLPSIATRANHGSIEAGLAAQRSGWAVELMDFPDLRLRPATPGDAERRRIAQESGGLLAGDDSEPTTLWEQPPYAA